MPRRRGNPALSRGGQPLQSGRTAATDFEMQVRQLRLTKETCASSAELRRWCERNRNRCYITRVAAETSGKSRWIQASAGESVRPANYTLRKDETVFQKARSWGRFYFPRKEAAPRSAAQSETKRRST